MKSAAGGVVGVIGQMIFFPTSMGSGGELQENTRVGVASAAATGVAVAAGTQLIENISASQFTQAAMRDFLRAMGMVIP